MSYLTAFASPLRWHGIIGRPDLGSMLALRRSRRRLMNLDDHLLRDVGLSRSEAMAEADRPAWNAPAHWLR
ncbi:DUF1127 domain-containing protein [Rubellimicrobium rubrum]|uniref:DUF1127 domain-containing protein n=1 Tax=Rubellimicrobium rubrum TaxID=2585369 RepID=A0A5C4MZV4_9RHOB|nr:DUF1127 domain-containing protein [Rubellimicrobium rubrum]TNC51846.1 DUF1127 domain-containing protein [Rubellimicrobium rubrum]